MTLILLSVAWYSSATPFPGVAALLPVLGSALVLSLGEGGNGIATPLLTNRAFVSLGRISYSLYLWHFPVIALFEYTHLRRPSVGEGMGLTLLSIAAAACSYQLVEQPFRRRTLLASRRACYAAAFCSAAVLAAVLLGVHFKKGLPGRFSAKDRLLVGALSDRPIGREECMRKTAEQVLDGDLCRLGQADDSVPSVLVWGDSHAEALAAGIEASALRAGTSVRFVGRHGCAPQAPPRPSGRSRECAEFNASVLHFIDAHPEVRDVIMVSRWNGLGEVPADLQAQADGRATSAQLATAVTRLTSAGKRAWLVGPVPESLYHVPRALYAQSLGFDRDIDIRPSVAVFLRQRSRTFEVLEELSQSSPKVRLLRPHHVLCGPVTCAVSRDGRPFYFDENHLTTTGARAVSATFDPVFAGG